MSIKIEKMREEHIKDIAALEKECFSQPWSEGSLREELHKDNSNFLVALTEDALVVGYIGFNFVLDEGYITNIAVAPKFRRCGIAQNLLNKIIAFAQSQRLSFISLEVRASNAAAISLYEKFGFKEAGLRRNFYTLPQENAVIMTKILDFLRKNSLSPIKEFHVNKKRLNKTKSYNPFSSMLRHFSAVEV